jgi:predicted DNA-binding transcriptional regulator YafY
VVFTQAEALGLVMAVLDAQPAADDVDDLVGSALGKVIKALPETVGREAAALREHASAAPGRSVARPDTATTSALVTAVANRRRVLVTYRSESGREWESEVDPWAVVVRHGRWYLLCHSHQADATRTYRIDRVQTVQLTTLEFSPPQDLDPVTALEENLGIGWEYHTRVVIDAPLTDVAPWIRPPMGRLEPTDEGCVLTGSTSNPTMYASECLARLPFAFRVDSGPELRAAVASLASRFTTAVATP